MWRALAGASLWIFSACLAAPGSGTGNADAGAGPAADGQSAVAACPEPASAMTSVLSPDRRRCYVRLLTGAVDEGSTGCGELGGYLVALDDDDEQAFLIEAFDIVSADAWIGLRRGADGGWAWMDSEPLSWTSWGPGSPDRDAGDDCVELEIGTGDCTGGCWDNTACVDEVHQAICEIEI